MGGWQNITHRPEYSIYGATERYATEQWSSLRSDRCIRFIFPCRRKFASFPSSSARVFAYSGVVTLLRRVPFISLSVRFRAQWESEITRRCLASFHRDIRSSSMLHRSRHCRQPCPMHGDKLNDFRLGEMAQSRNQIFRNVARGSFREKCPNHRVNSNPDRNNIRGRVSARWNTEKEYFIPFLLSMPRLHFIYEQTNRLSA